MGKYRHARKVTKIDQCKYDAKTTSYQRDSDTAGLIRVILMDRHNI